MGRFNENQNIKISLNAKNQYFQEVCHISDTLFDQKSPVQLKTGFPPMHRQTHTHTHTTHGHCDLETESAQWADPVKNSLKSFDLGCPPHSLKIVQNEAKKFLKKFLKGQMRVLSSLKSFWCSF